MKSNLLLCVIFIPNVLIQAETSDYEDRHRKAITHFEKIIDKLLTSQKLEDLVEKAVRRAMEKRFTNVSNLIEKIKNSTDSAHNESTNRINLKKERTTNHNFANTVSVNVKRSSSGLGKVNIRPIMKKDALAPFKDLSLQYKRFTKGTTNVLLPKTSKNYKNSTDADIQNRHYTSTKETTQTQLTKANYNNKSAEERSVNKEDSNLSAENDNFDSLEIEADAHEMKNNEYYRKHQKVTKLYEFRSNNRKHNIEQINMKEDKSDDYSQSTSGEYTTNRNKKQNIKSRESYNKKNISKKSNSESDKSSIDSELVITDQESYDSSAFRKKSISKSETNKNVSDDKNNDNLSKEDDMDSNKDYTNAGKVAVTEMKIRREGDKLFALENLSDYKEYHEMLAKSTTEQSF